MKKIMFFVLVVVFFVSGVFAQDLPMLKSHDALRVWALEQTAQVYASISTSLPAGNNNWAYVPVSEPTAQGIIDTIAGMNLSVNVANPKDRLFTWASANNADGDTLFSGYRQFSLVQDGDGYILPSGYGDVTLTLVDNVPIKVGEDAQSAVVYFLDPSGQTREQYSLNVYNGKVYFPRQLAGRNAILATYHGEGSWSYWDINNGSRISPDHFNISIRSMIKGVTTVMDGNVLLAVPTENGVGDNLTVEFISRNYQKIFISMETTEGKLFKGALVRKSGEMEWKQYQLSDGEKYFWLSLELGTYYIIPIWDPQDLTEPEDPWYPPYYGGKG